MDDDTLLLNSGINLAAFDIAMSDSRKEDVLGFTFINDDKEITRDTVWIAKENYPHLESVDCGPKFFHTVTEVRYTRNRIDRIELIKKNVAYESTEEFPHISFSCLLVCCFLQQPTPSGRKPQSCPTARHGFRAWKFRQKWWEPR